MNNWQSVLALWLAAVNLAALLLMWADKYKAQHGARRVPERVLFLLPNGANLNHGFFGQIFAHASSPPLEIHQVFPAGVSSPEQ